MGESHILVLVPETVNGNPFTLDSLNELTQTPKEGSGGHATKYDVYWNSAKWAFGSNSAPASHWVLFTRDVIPETRKKDFTEQQSVLNTKKGDLPYEVPTTLDATTAVVMHYVRTGEKLYETETRCIEKVRTAGVAFGNGGDGACIRDCFEHGAYSHVGLSGFRKF